MKMLAVEAQHPTEALESIVDIIALESISLPSIMNRIVDLIPTLATSAKSFLTSVNRDKPELASIHINETVLGRCFEKSAYSDIVSLSHPVPPGFTGNLYEYTEVLEKQISYINALPAKLTAFNQFISELISSAQSRRSIRSQGDTYRNMAASRKILLNASRDYFKGTNNRVAFAKYGDVIASNAQYVQFSKTTAGLVDEANRTSFKDTEKLVRDTKELLEALSDAARGGQLSDMSSAAFDTLGAYTETIAREVEMYAVVLFAIADLRACVLEGNEKLIRALRY